MSLPGGGNGPRGLRRLFSTLIPGPDSDKGSKFPSTCAKISEWNGVDCLSVPRLPPPGWLGPLNIPLFLLGFACSRARDFGPDVSCKVVGK